MTRPPRPGWAARVADVTRSADQARVTYDRLARWYDLIEAPFERRARAAGLRLLDARQGEHILEIGFGTGHTLAALQRQVGTTGLLVGIDLALRMAQRTRRRLGTPAAHLTVAVLQGDARHLPLHDASFDAVTLAFTLDLISTDDIPIVLSECRRVLRTHGRQSARRGQRRCAARYKRVIRFDAAGRSRDKMTSRPWVRSTRRHSDKTMGMSSVLMRSRVKAKVTASNEASCRGR